MKLRASCAGWRIGAESSNRTGPRRVVHGGGDTRTLTYPEFEAEVWRRHLLEPTERMSSLVASEDGEVVGDLIADLPHPPACAARRQCRNGRRNGADGGHPQARRQLVEPRWDRTGSLPQTTLPLSPSTRSASSRRKESAAAMQLSATVSPWEAYSMGRARG